MKSVAIIGKFHTSDGVCDGQAVKTNIVTEEIERKLGKENVLRINTFGWKKNPIRLAVKCCQAVHRSENVIFMTDAGGIKVFPLLLNMANLRGRCKLHYVVIGGWLPSYLEEHKMVSALLRRFDGIYVETDVMIERLLRLGFNNVFKMPNCKKLLSITDDELVYNNEEPYRLCTFSRVMQEKGIEDAVEAVKAVNECFGRIFYTLDIYGQVDSEQEAWFQELSANFPQEIAYRGVVPFDKSVEVIKNYHALLFPTRFYTEGIPGTIIDAYAAGVPVIASKWESFSDIVQDGFTGIGYTFLSEECLISTLEEIAKNPDTIFKMKNNCLRKAEEYMPQNVMGTLFDAIS